MESSVSLDSDWLSQYFHPWRKENIRRQCRTSPLRQELPPSLSLSLIKHVHSCSCLERTMFSFLFDVCCSVSHETRKSIPLLLSTADFLLLSFRFLCRPLKNDSPSLNEKLRESNENERRNNIYLVPLRRLHRSERESSMCVFSFSFLNTFERRTSSFSISSHFIVLIRFPPLPPFSFDCLSFSLSA